MSKYNFNLILIFQNILNFNSVFIILITKNKISNNLCYIVRYL